ncbi:hypothetical protein K492DRAFT_174956 [Lichtheimia hyalospora FSU 10163]|nr:hypothetical protein K492DRAFT_174956 [Lichtheimia hyalospora FSU 10163]
MFWIAKEDFEPVPRDHLVECSYAEQNLLLDDSTLRFFALEPQHRLHQEKSFEYIIQRAL